jgi:hypothetical protein
MIGSALLYSRRGESAIDDVDVCSSASSGEPVTRAVCVHCSYH